MPCRSPRGGSGQAGFELATTRDGRRVLPLYTSLTTLVLCCGTRQQWIGVRVAELDGLRRALRADGVVVDVPLPGRSIEHESIRW